MSKERQRKGRSPKDRPQSAKTTAYLFLVVSSLWLGWSGHLSFEHPLLLGLGLVSALLVVYLCRRMEIVDSEMLPLDLTFRTLRYVVWLSWEVLVSSLDVLKRSWSLEVTPEVLTVEGSQKTDLGLVSYANSITLTPGTTSLNSDPEAHSIRVHAISSEAAEALREGTMDRWLTWVEGGSGLSGPAKGAASTASSTTTSAARDGDA